MFTTGIWLIIDAFMIAWCKSMYNSSKSTLDFILTNIWISCAIIDCITFVKYL
jgi:hypothetical protein